MFPYILFAGTQSVRCVPSSCRRAMRYSCCPANTATTSAAWHPGWIQTTPARCVVRSCPRTTPTTRHAKSEKQRKPGSGKEQRTRCRTMNLLTFKRYHKFFPLTGNQVARLSKSRRHQNVCIEYSLSNLAGFVRSAGLSSSKATPSSLCNEENAIAQSPLIPYMPLAYCVICGRPYGGPRSPCPAYCSPPRTDLMPVRQDFVLQLRTSHASSDNMPLERSGCVCNSLQRSLISGVVGRLHTQPGCVQVFLLIHCHALLSWDDRDNAFGSCALPLVRFAQAVRCKCADQAALANPD